MDFEADPTVRPPWVLGSMIAALLAIVLLWLWDGSDAGVVLQIGTYIVGVIAVVHLASAASNRYRFWYWALMVLLIGLLSVIFHPHPPVEVSLVLAVSPAVSLFVVGPRSHFRLRIRTLFETIGIIVAATLLIVLTLYLPAMSALALGAAPLFGLLSERYRRLRLRAICETASGAALIFFCLAAGLTSEIFRFTGTAAILTIASVLVYVRCNPDLATAANSWDSAEPWEFGDLG